MSNSSQDHKMFKEFRNDDHFSLTACTMNKYGKPAGPKYLSLLVLASMFALMT